MSKLSLSSSSSFSGGVLTVVCPRGVRAVGVESPSSVSNAKPSPLSSARLSLDEPKDPSTGASSNGRCIRLSPASDDHCSSLAVLNDSVLDDGYVNGRGRSGVAKDSVVLGGLGSGVGGLR